MKCSFFIPFFHTRVCNIFLYVYNKKNCLCMKNEDEGTTMNDTKISPWDEKFGQILTSNCNFYQFYTENNLGLEYFWEYDRVFDFEGKIIRKRPWKSKTRSFFDIFATYFGLKVIFFCLEDFLVYFDDFLKLFNCIVYWFLVDCLHAKRF